MYLGRLANPCSNKYTYSKYIEHCQKVHREKLAKMKPAIDNKAPKKPSHFKKNLKREQMMEDKFVRIERENRILLEKMSHIMQKKTLDNNGNSYQYTKSLNKSYRKRELQRITLENKKILRRIQQREPNYNHLKWEQDRKVHESYIKNICEFPYQKKDSKKTRQHKRRQDSRLEISRSGLIPSLSADYKKESTKRLLSKSVSESANTFMPDSPVQKHNELLPL